MRAASRCILSVLFSATAALAQHYVISTFAGARLPQTPAQGTSINIPFVRGLAIDPSGNLYFSLSRHAAVFKLDQGGVVTRVAGTGDPGLSGDGGPALTAQFGGLDGVTLDASGNLYIADGGNNRVRKITLNGIITTVAGDGTYSYSGDGGPAISARLRSPSGLALDASGALYIADAGNNCIRKVSPDGTITTVAGDGTAGFSGDGGPASKSRLNAPVGVLVDASQNLYITDSGNHRVRKVSPDGIITTVAGNGTPGSSGDGQAAASAQLQNPVGLAVDASENLYISDFASRMIRKVAPNGIISTVAGNVLYGDAGDGGLASAASLINPAGLAVDAAGNLYMACQASGRIRKISTDGIINTVAGGGPGPAGPAILAGIGPASSLALDQTGSVFVAESLGYRVRKVTGDGLIATVAGTGTYGFFVGDNGPATAARVSGLGGMTVDADSNLYLGDGWRVRKVAPNGTISTVAGSGFGYAGDGGPATSAQMRNASGLRVDASGALYITDQGNNCVRKVSPDGTITTVVGNGTPGFSGDGGPATSAQLNSPVGLALDASGALYIADQSNQRIRKVSPSGTITTFAGKGTPGYSGDGGPAADAQLNSPAGISLDASGNLYIADQANNVIRVINAQGVINTVAGNGSAGFAGDGGPALNGRLWAPTDVAVDSAGNVYVADNFNSVVRVLTPAGTRAVLAVKVSHVGDFVVGGSYSYTVTVSNAVSAGPASGTVTVTLAQQAGLTVTSLSGTGWTCGGIVCTRHDALNAGSSYPPISVWVDVDATASAQFTYWATVSGGGAPGNAATDLTMVRTVSFVLAQQQALNYYVATTGSDANPGSLEQPFRTIQKAASVMLAGDTAYIRGGIYRETVVPATSGTPGAPITFQPYNGESVTVSGADVIPVSSWANSSGNIYKAPIAWDLGEGNNQIFLDGQMMIEARWPNTTLDLSHPTVAVTGGGSYVDGGSGLTTGTITGLSLPSRPAGYWNGATIHISLNAGPGPGPSWSWQTGTVVGAADSQISFTLTKWANLSSGTQLEPGNPYYLSGKPSELDAAGEWFLDSASSTLYLWTPASDSPARHLVEAKRRQFAFDLRGRSFVTIQGLNLFGATITSDAQSQYLVLDSLAARYLSQYSLVTQPGSSGLLDSGIILSGKNCVLRNSSIAWSAGNGVALNGSGHRVFNNAIHDCDYTPTLASPIAAGTSLSDDLIIAWNTIYNAGNHGIKLDAFQAQNFRDGRILHNEFYNYGLQTTDLGCVNTMLSDGKGTEIAYNLCHDTQAWYGNGIYLDGGDSNFVVHHNVVWNVQHSLMLGSPSTNNKVYNNTFSATDQGLDSYYGGGLPLQLPGTEIENNIFVAPMAFYPNQPTGLVIQNNLQPGTDFQFVDPAHGNFQLKSTSPAIDAGLAIPPYTDGYTGKAPDIGAYEYGQPPWKAGGGQPVATVLSAASYISALAPESIAVVFGSKLATSSMNAPSGTLPTSLAGTTVMITDGAGVDRLAPIFYVTPTQVCFEVPLTAAQGIAMITVTSGDGTVSVGSAPLFATAPGLFSADSSGKGLAAAQLVRVKPDGSQSTEPVVNFDAAQNRFVAIPIDLGPATDQVFLVLYGTGIRGRSSYVATVGGKGSQVIYAGPQGVYPGLDQVDVRLQRGLIGSGDANVVVAVDGQASNAVTVNIR